jgi:SAM-dependent methyltransferase
MAGAGEDTRAGRPYRRPMTVWALGDYPRFAREMIWNFGPTLVAACDIGPGQRVLDVAAGTGNVAIRAAEAGADVVACDLEPAQLEAGREEAPEIDWVQADAEALPFADGEFDVVTSSAGVMFAPDHQAAADELVRVCRREGTIGLITFTPEGMAGEFFRIFGAEPPTLWGVEDHVRGLFGDRLALRFTRSTYVERAPGGPEASSTTTRRRSDRWWRPMRASTTTAARSSTAPSWTSPGAGTPATPTPSSRSSTC